ncbi:MAG: iron-containing alcohol dehydrogenase, partial [Oscillospiraceae bacterium]|nr:iron-containing alcohol dehydrogenase [Oscillospiraceae bacterium]
MNHIDFYMPVRIISGENAVTNNADSLAALGKRALIVTSKNAARASGALDDFANALESMGIAFCVYDGILPNPHLSSCRKAGLISREFAADFIIGIGGGSPLDAAKAAAIFAANPEINDEEFFALRFVSAPPPLVLAGTTAGTGSEITNVAVLTMENGVKRSIKHNACYAKIAFCDPRYTCSQSFDTTVSTALDALCHATEGWFAGEGNPILDRFAEMAFRILSARLPAFLEADRHPEISTRADLLYASIYAGVVLDARGTSYPHPFGYVLTEDYGIPHGRACAVFLPSLLARADRFVPRRADAFYSVFG